MDVEIISIGRLFNEQHHPKESNIIFKSSEQRTSSTDKKINQNKFTVAYKIFKLRYFIFCLFVDFYSLYLSIVYIYNRQSHVLFMPQITPNE